MKKTNTKFLHIILNLFLFIVISFSPIFMFSAYNKGKIFLNADKLKLKQYKVDSLKFYTSNDWGGGPSAYYVFFNHKKRLKIPILDKNSISFSKRVNKVYRHFNTNTIKNYVNNREVLKNDSIYIWESPTAILYGFKNEKKIDLTSYRNRLFFDIFIIVKSMVSIFYLVKVEINKRKNNGNTRKNRKLQKQLKKKEQMEYLLGKMNK